MAEGRRAPRPSTTVLLVEPDPRTRSTIGGWLASAGHQVLVCPGPGEPDYSCLGGRGCACPLADAAGVVVLNLRQDSDEAMLGVPGWRLLLYYVERGRKVVALADAEDPVHPFPDADVAVVRRPPERSKLIEAVRALATGRAATSPFSDTAFAHRTRRTVNGDDPAR